MSRRPNILFLMADQMAAAPLPCYGGGVVRAPHLQQLAERGVVFDVRAGGAAGAKARARFPFAPPLEEHG